MSESIPKRAMLPTITAIRRRHLQASVVMSEAPSPQATYRLQHPSQTCLLTVPGALAALTILLLHLLNLLVLFVQFTCNLCRRHISSFPFLNIRYCSAVHFQLAGGAVPSLWLSLLSSAPLSAFSLLSVLEGASGVAICPEWMATGAPVFGRLSSAFLSLSMVLLALVVWVTWESCLPKRKSTN